MAGRGEREDAGGVLERSSRRGRRGGVTCSDSDRSDRSGAPAGRALWRHNGLWISGADGLEVAEKSAGLGDHAGRVGVLGCVVRVWGARRRAAGGLQRGFGGAGSAGVDLTAGSRVGGWDWRWRTGLFGLERLGGGLLDGLGGLHSGRFAGGRGPLGGEVARTELHDPDQSEQVRCRDAADGGATFTLRTSCCSASA